MKTLNLKTLILILATTLMSCSGSKSESAFRPDPSQMNKDKQTSSLKNNVQTAVETGVSLEKPCKQLNGLLSEKLYSVWQYPTYTWNEIAFAIVNKFHKEEFQNFITDQNEKYNKLSDDLIEKYQVKTIPI